ncbi:MAG: class I tRNA ligase family protein, partial [Parcubacteria group bacterium]|nr:class I tRNA ligase family protein [Parcubacteria group bacterium]
GGIDHIGTHHTNEMAQSEAATGKPFVHYWLHNEFVSVNGEKMSKSKGNIITLRDLEEKGYDPLAYRYWLLTAHYRTPVNFTWEALKGAKEAIGRLGLGYAFLGKDFGVPLKQYLNRFEESIENDMNTPQAVAIAHELLDEKKISATDKKSTLLKMDSILGFNLSSYVLAEEKRKKDLPEEVRRFAEEREAEREQAKKTKNWKKSDELREKIRKAGYEVIDFPDGQRFYPFK